MTDLDSVSDELYGMPPNEFTAHRDTAARAARADGDKALATAIAALRKPTVSAWLMNLLVRDDASLAPQLSALAEGMRAAEASLDGEAMRDLNRQRRQLVASLVSRARRLAAPAGQRVGDAVVQELDRTLMAALADPRVTAEVLSGRLTGPREYVGFGAATAPAPHLAVAGDAAGDAALASAGRPSAPTAARSTPSGRGRLTLVEPKESATARQDRERELARAAAQAKAREALDRARADLQAAQERERSDQEAEADAEQTLQEWSGMTGTVREEVASLEKELRRLATALERGRSRLSEAEHHEAHAAAALTTIRGETRDARAAVRSARTAVAKSSRALEQASGAPGST